MSASVATPAKKSAKSRKAPSSHPPYGDMIKRAVKDLKERGGSSRQAIAKYIKNHYKVDDRAESHLRRALVSGVKSGKLVHTKGIGASGSFKLADKAASPKKASSRPKSAKRKSKTPKKKAKRPKTPTKPKEAGAPNPSMGNPGHKAAPKPKASRPKSAKPKKAKKPKKSKATKPKRPVAKKTPKKAVKK